MNEDLKEEFIYRLKTKTHKLWNYNEVHHGINGSDYVFKLKFSFFWLC